MNTREQFGKYLLLKKLTEDPIGETFRAGVLGDNGMERVALLRVFNGQGVDGPRLWQAAQERDGVQSLLRSPNLAEGIEMGAIEGIPYVAYEYVSGKNLATLLEQAAIKQSFIPAEHALLITERIALALAAAEENRHRGERILHGFLVPHLVMISNEGEARLLGFEMAPGLRAFAANPVIRQHFGRYLAPEALSGAPSHRADDIYSLGVILLELLTGRPLPPPGPDGFGSVIDGSVVATEGTPIPPDLANLLKQSLVAREHRIDDVVAWHKTLNQWMFDGQYNPTTFNLAFFMHNLFRQEIERESQEIEIEKTLPVPVPVPAAVSPTAQTQAVPRPDSGVYETAGAGAAGAGAAGSGAGSGAAGTGVHDTTVVHEVPGGVGAGYAEAGRPPSGVDVVPPGTVPPEAIPETGKSRAGLFAVLAAVLLLAGAAGGYFWWSARQQAQEAARIAAQAPPPAPEPEPVVPAGPSPEEINLQIKELIEQRASEMEEQLRQQYDQQLQDLNRQLDSAKRQETERLERERQLAEEKAQEALEAQRQEEERLAAEAAAEAAAEEEEPEPPEEPVEVAENPPPAAELAPEPAPQVQAPTAAAPQVRRGDLVEMGPGVKPPEIQRRPTPRFPEMARRLNQTSARVLIRVLIDENGRVLKAELAGKEQGYGFDKEALSSARKSIYRPATKNGVPVKIWHTLAVEFRR